VTHAQAIDNLYWWEIFTCCNNPIPKCISNGQHQCQHCGGHLPKHEKRNEINPKVLKDYFGECKIFETEIEALKEAEEIYNEIMNDCYGILEYGINFIRGWENKFFPE